MSLPPAFLDDLRARTTLSALVGATVKLVRAGAGEWKACCPFHQEKSPSFTVNDAKAFYHCFGCGAHGDAIRWMTDQCGFTFLDAVRELAAKAGMVMPAPDPRVRAVEAARAPQLDVLERAARWYCVQREQLVASAARAYLRERRVSRDQIEAFGIGYAPASGLRRALGDVGEEELIAVGLLGRAEDGRIYERFRDRIMFPIRDPRGQVIGFGGRTVSGGEPKYLNSPDTALFDKGVTLFNLDRAAPAARKAGRIVVVEGYLDVIALAAVGIEEAVAPLGTALTERQLELLWRVSPEPILCFDGDAAGGRAAIRAANRALPMVGPDRTLNFVSLPSGLDPDDLVRAQGAAPMLSLLAKPMPLCDEIWHSECAATVDTPEARAGLQRRLDELAETIRDREARFQYRAEFRRRLRRRSQRCLSPDGGGAITTISAPSAVHAKMISAVLRGLAFHPDVAAREWERIVRLPAASSRQAEARKLLAEETAAGRPVSPASIDALLGESIFHGLRFSFLRAGVDGSTAAADLSAAIDAVIEHAEGTHA